MTNERTQSVPQDTIERDFHQGTHTRTQQVSNDTAQGVQPAQAPHVTQSASSAQGVQPAASTAQSAKPAAKCAQSVPQSVNTQIPCLLRAEHLGIKHLTGKAFWDMSLRVTPHQILALSGEHGTGKTALLLSLAGVMRTTHGSIHIMDLPMQHYRSILRCYTGIALVRGLNDFYHTQTIKEALNCELGIAQKLYRRRLRHERALAQRPETMQVPHEFLSSKNELPSFESARQLLEMWGVTAPLSQAIGTLTIDEQLRVSIALALLKKPLLLFIDDIESELTDAQTEQLLRDIRTYVNTHTCACVVEMLQHDLHRHADCVLKLSKGERVPMPNKDANGATNRDDGASTPSKALNKAHNQEQNKEANGAPNKARNQAPNRDDGVPAPNKSTKVRSLSKEAHDAR